MLDLLLVVGSSWGLVVFTRVPSFDSLQIMTGLVTTLVAPGYALLAMLYPAREELVLFKRLILSVGLSIVIATVLGLLLSFSSWGINTNSISASLASFVTTVSIAALFRRYWRQSMTRPRFGWKPLVTTLRNPKSRFLHSLLILLTSGAVILSLVGFFLYREQALPPRQPFTEFAVLDGSGSTKNYITNLTVGTPVQYTVSITNRGNTSAEYRLQVWLSERLQDEQVPFVLSAGERWEHPVIWTPSQPAQRTWLEFKLVASDQRIPVYKVGLWVTVRE